MQTWTLRQAMKPVWLVGFSVGAVLFLLALVLYWPDPFFRAVFFAIFLPFGFMVWLGIMLGVSVIVSCIVYILQSVLPNTGALPVDATTSSEIIPRNFSVFLALGVLVLATFILVSALSGKLLDSLNFWFVGGIGAAYTAVCLLWSTWVDKQGGKIVRKYAIGGIVLSVVYLSFTIFSFFLATGQ